ncbi:sirohydrochlorin chelatase [Microbacterium abyssi]|uniref:sirohydrochlorin chelatase n=1 Tax=Microbacterium abyssi TaxID=2782166 RepID=UPI00188881DA|nr:CbiX/SirB N-terminal domain-containing protein [Microbacterium sp. A18JL241]
MTALIACSHGTADAAGREAVQALVASVRTLVPEAKVVHAVVDVEHPQIDVVTAAESRRDDVIVVPLLLSVGHHTAVDISRSVQAHPNARQTAPLGTHPLITEVLADRLSSALPDGWHEGDHVVLAAAGSSNPDAVRDVEVAAGRLRDRVPVPVSVGFASASTPRIGDAVAAARAVGAQRVIAASHVLAPGFFAGLVARAGADVVSAPLAPDERIATIVAERFRTAWHAG